MLRSKILRNRLQKQAVYSLDLWHQRLKVFVAEKAPPDSMVTGAELRRGTKEMAVLLSHIQVKNEKAIGLNDQDLRPNLGNAEVVGSPCHSSHSSSGPGI